MSAKKDSFVHLHLHTHYSLLDGLGKPADYFARAKEMGMPAAAITDHGSVYGLIDWYQTGLKAGVKPILGCEAYVARHGRHQKRPGVDVRPFHLVLLAENLTGYQNLMRLMSKAQLEGYYYKPRIDYELLEQYSSGIIASSACLQGEVPSKLLSGNEEEAIEAVRRYQKLFGEKNFFLEIQDHPEIEDQRKLNELMIAFAQKVGVPLVATNDCHYVNREDAEAHDVLMCVQTGKQIDDVGRMSMLGSDLSFRAPADLREAFQHVPEACDNTLRIAERCNVELPLGKRLIPTYSTPFNAKPEDYFIELCWDGLHKRFGIEIPADKKRIDGTDAGQSVVAQVGDRLTPTEEKQLIERLEYELGVIIQMGFANYFLIVWDFVKYAKESGVAVGPGRGSAAGSLISYCLGITNLNPLKYGLLFERFLNPERVSMPDIDIDFADNRRDEVLEYVSEKYGRENVARIITFGTLAAKAAVKDAGRVFGVPFAEMNAFTKLIPSRPGISLHDAYEAEPELQKAVKKEPFKKVWEIARRLEGVIRQVGVHACAVVIADKALPEYTPLQYAPGKETDIITQYSMKPIEDIGLLKMDFLGLRNLTIIKKCLNIIKRTKNEDINIEAIPMDDKKTFQLFARADTTGVFQFESSGMRRYLKDLKPTQFEDLIAMVSLFRPGPMENIPQYIRGKHDPKSIKYPHPILQHFLEETYGVAVYQEQIQQIAQEFAGFSLGQGYLLIKAVAKKIPELLEEQRAKFTKGAEEKGHKASEAKKLFDLIEPFAGYGFNKSHAACYAYIAYQTGYLKSRYPTEFMAALLTADHGNSDRLTIDIEECDAMGIKVLPPSVNDSLLNFTVAKEGEIRFGLAAIKGVGEGPINSIIAARESGKFKDIADFASRVEPSVINKRTLEALAQSGALDELGERAAILASTVEMSDFAKTAHTQANTDQASLFAVADAPALEFHLPRVAPATNLQKLRWERDLLGMYVSSHPLAGLKKYLGKKAVLIEKLDKKNTGMETSVGGIVTAVRKMITKKTGQTMAFFTLEDPTGMIEVSVFAKTYADYGNQIVEGEMLMVSGRLDWRNDAFQVSAYELKQVDLEKMRIRAEESGFLDNSTGRAPKKIVTELEEGEEESAAELHAILPYQIKLGANADPAILPKIKALLVASRDEETGTLVEILIGDSGSQSAKRVKVPFKVGVGQTLEEEIGKLMVA
jgi:DNA polymerase-3 subunit alpha